MIESFKMGILAMKLVIPYAETDDHVKSAPPSRLHEIGIADLPTSLQKLVTEIGWEPTLALVTAYGGETLQVPRGVLDSPELIGLQATLGHAAAHILIHHYSGRCLYVPRCHEIQRKQKAREIVSTFESLKGEMSSNRAVSHLASQYGVSDRSIWLILKKSS